MVDFATANAPAKRSSQRDRTQLLCDVFVLLALSAAVSYLHWSILGDFWYDAPRWIFEVFRFHSGEWPYKDYSFQYPPLMIFVFNWTMDLLGPSFAAIQITLDVLSCALVLCFYALARRLITGRLPLLLSIAFLASTSAYQSTFCLFSMKVYTPSLLLGSIGLLILLITLLADRRHPDYRRRLLLGTALGGTICLLDKPEYAAAAVVVLLIHSVQNWSVRGTGGLRTFLRAEAPVILAGVLPATVVYAYVIYRTSWRGLVEGITAYGLAGVTCPLWPTGVGLLGITVAIAQGWFILRLLQVLRALHRGRTSLLLLARTALWGVFSSIAFAVYAPALFEPKAFIGFLASQRYAEVTYFLANSTALMPAMWLLFSVALVVLYRLLRRGVSMRPSGFLANLLLLTCAIAALSARTLFNYHIEQLPKVSQAAAPFVFVAFAYLMLNLAKANCSGRGAAPRGPRPSLVVIMALLLFGVGRFAGGWYQTRGVHWTTVRTKAGSVRIEAQSAEVYTFLKNRISPGDRLLDLAYGGGVNFALQVLSPSFMTQYQALLPQERLMQYDLERVRGRSPRFVIADTGPNLGTVYGICGNIGCMFPRIVWHSSANGCNPGMVMPIVGYLNEHYHEIAALGTKRILERNGPSAGTL